MKDLKNSFFNKPLPIIIALIVIIVVLLINIMTSKNVLKFKIGKLSNEEIAINNVHYAINNDMRYFFADNAIYLGEDKDVYSFEIGYYVVDNNDNYKSFLVRSEKLDNPVSLAQTIRELSAWSVVDSKSTEYYFTKDVLDNIDKIHFMIKASTSEDGEVDIKLDYPLELTKISK